jgi:hypothetical protein
MIRHFGAEASGVPKSNGQHGPATTLPRPGRQIVPVERRAGTGNDDGNVDGPDQPLKLVERLSRMGGQRDQFLFDG